VMVAAERQDPVLACWLQVAVATGARRGEVCALRWSDIDFTTATVRIERSVSATKSAGVAIRPTKTGRVRLVSLTGGAVDALVRQRARAERTAADAGRTVDADDQIFTSDPDARRPWRPELVTRRWERLRVKNGLDHMRVHDLRHFVATQLLTAGIDVRTVANRLGHARTSTTLDIYWAWVPARDREAARYLEEVLFEDGSAPSEARPPPDDSGISV
jgi:integrase